MMIYDWVRKQAGKNPERIAISCSNRHISYGRLESESNRLACLLLKSGLEPGDRVGLLLDKTPHAVTAMHGIMKAGGIYVPLNIDSPAVRIGDHIGNAELSFLMIDSAAFGKYKLIAENRQSTHEIPWIWWTGSTELIFYRPNPLFTRRDLEDQPDYPFGKIRNEDFPAQILFVPGPDGDPRGVVTTHKNILALIQWAVCYFEIEGKDRISGYSPLHVDLSLFDIYSTLAAGAHLYMIPSGMTGMPEKISGCIMESDITQWFSEPSILETMARFDVVPRQGYPGLDRLIWCGGELPVPALRHWMQRLPGVSFTNLYGRTETTVASSYYTIPDIPEEGSAVPIGTPCDGEKLLILDEDQNPVSEGVEGDLYIAGAGLSPGYWRDIKATSASFTWRINEKSDYERIHKTGDRSSWDKNGNVYHHGYSDHKIISRGYRVELGEIEAALGGTDMLSEFAVVPVRKEGFGGQAIGCAYVSSDWDDDELPLRLKQSLVSKVPGYMMPHYWASYDKLPRSKNGEIDRKVLSKAFE